MMKYKFILAFLFLSIWAKADDSIPSYRLDLGIRSMKFVGFYLENGFAVEYSSEKIFDHRLQFGASIVSSHLGSAFFTNAVPTTQFELAIIKHFRHGSLFQPFVRLNTGLAHANYRSDLFDNLPQNGFLLSAEFGLSYRIPLRKENFSIKSGLGYNVFSGNGVEGLSTVYPLYGQISVLYRLK